VVGCPIAGYLLTHCKQRRVLLGAVIGNTVGCFWFGLAGPEHSALGKWNLFGAKFLIGLTQSAILIYSPVWVDEFAPPEYTTQWISLLQAMVAIGIMLGYVVGGVFTETFGPTYWRVAILIQASVLFCFIPLYMYVSGKNVNAVGGREARIQSFATAHKARLLADRKAVHAEGTLDVRPVLTLDDSSDSTGNGVARLSSASGEASPRPSQDGVEDGCDCESATKLIKSPLYMLLTLALCGLYFTVTGIQYWITDYLEQVIGAPKDKVLTAFAITSCTAPAMGVVFGGWLVDRMGGYKDESGEAVCTALKVCSWFGVGALAAAIPAALLQNFSWVVGSIWVVLFCGGALLPSATGVCMNAVDTSMRALASSYSMCAYNLLGYAAAPFVCGYIADEVGLIWGFRVVMFVSGFSVICICGAWYAALCEYERSLAISENESESLLSTDQQITAGEPPPGTQPAAEAQSPPPGAAAVPVNRSPESQGLLSGTEQGVGLRKCYQCSQLVLIAMKCSALSIHIL
jgi:MFS family permease